MPFPLLCLLLAMVVMNKLFPGRATVLSKMVMYIIIDVSATVNGYFCDFDRNFGFCKVSDVAVRANEAVWDAPEAAMAIALLGTTTANSITR